MLGRRLAIFLVLVALTALLAPTALARPRRALAASRLHRPHHRRPHRRRAGPHAPLALMVGGCANASVPASGTSSTVLDVAVVCLVNQQRAQHGLPVLQASARLDRSAQGWTDAMVARDIFTHGADFSSRISAVGVNWSYAGENIAAGFATPAAVVTAWMASPDHCQNILDPHFSLIGSGVSPHGVLSVGAATWTQDFALLAGQPVPSHNGGPARGCPYHVSLS